MAWFHEDFDLDDPTPEEVLTRFFREGSSPQGIRAIARAIRRLVMSELSDEQLSATLLDLGCYYNPMVGGESTRTWLKWMLDRFEAQTIN